MFPGKSTIPVIASLIRLMKRQEVANVFHYTAWPPEAFAL